METYHGGNHYKFAVSGTASQTIGRYKRRHHEFVPMLEDNQMMWRNLYYVALNGFMLFNSCGLTKSWKEDSAEYP
jgi:hypothetical protein